MLWIDKKLYKRTLAVLRKEIQLPPLFIELKNFAEKEFGLTIYNITFTKHPFYNKYTCPCLLDTDEDKFEANTVSGWIIEQLDEIPKIGAQFNFENLNIEVMKSTIKRVQEIKVTVIVPESKR